MTCFLGTSPFCGRWFAPSIAGWLIRRVHKNATSHLSPKNNLLKNKLDLQQISHANEVSARK